MLLALGITLFAGLCTGIGGLVGVMTRRTNTKFLSGALGFSAGVMLYVSFVEILGKAIDSLAGVYDETTATWYGVGGFFVGMGVIMLIDKLVPHDDNPHEMHALEELTEEARTEARKRGLMRMGLLSALAIGLHNFPEGLATFLATLEDPGLGIRLGWRLRSITCPRG